MDVLDIATQSPSFHLDRMSHPRPDVGFGYVYEYYVLALRMLTRNASASESGVPQSITPFDR